MRVTNCERTVKSRPGCEHFSAFDWLGVMEGRDMGQGLEYKAAMCNKWRRTSEERYTKRHCVQGQYIETHEERRQVHT